MRIRANKKANLTFIMVLMALTVILVVAWFMLPLLDKIVNSSKETVAKGICGGMMAIRSKMTGFITGMIKSTSLFSLSPSCGNAYTAPCNQTADCLNKTRRQISYCWNITRNDPSSRMTCLYNLDINMSDTPAIKLGVNEICPDNPLCRTGEANVDKGNIVFENDFKANDKDSLSMEYNGEKVIVKCQGTCK